MASPSVSAPAEFPALTLDLLPRQQPPTPPREAKAPSSSLPATAATTVRLAEKSVNIQGTPLSVVTASECVAPGSSHRKRVEWSERPVYVEHADTPTSREVPRYSPASGRSTDSHQDRPVKGILKPTPVRSAPEQLLTGGGGSAEQLAEMLESMLQQLAGADTSARRDAYQVLVKALRASDNLPDRAALRDKMPVFAQFMQRDMTTRSGNAALDSNLITAALDLLSTFLQFPTVVTALPHDFAVFVVDHCIRSLEDPATPRVVARYLMMVAYRQSFPSKVLTSERVGRLIPALQGLDARKSIIVARIQIYHHLIGQSRSYMIAHASWLSDMFTDLLSTVKEIRPFAVQLGLEAGLSLSKERAFTRKVMDLLQEPVDDKTYVEFYLQRLNDMIKLPETIADVPKIWSVLALLLRQTLERWTHYNAFLQTIQLCFNTTDVETKREANVAWTRFIYTVQLDERSFVKTIAMLSSPLISQLKRRPGKSPERLRQSIHSAVCALFYYAFKPETTQNLMDTYWDSSLKDVVRQLEAGGEEHARFGVRILTSLFRSNPLGRLWNAERVADPQPFVPEELPPLDPKWVRKNSQRVFRAVAPILYRHFLDLANRESSTYKLWRALVGCVASAAAKDIMVSPETLTFVAEFFTVATAIWLGGPPRPTSEGDVVEPAVFLAAMKEFVLVVYKQLGALPFTEKMLARTKDQTFAVVAAPLSRPAKSTGSVQTPLMHMFLLFASIPPNVADDGAFAAFVHDMFTPLLESKPSQERPSVAFELIGLLSDKQQWPYGPWAFVAEHVTTSLLRAHVENSMSSTSSDTLPGREFRQVTNLLAWAMQAAPTLPQAAWLRLLDELRGRVKADCGDAGCAVSVVEPLARALFEHIGAVTSAEGPIPMRLISMARYLVSVAVHPKDWQTLDAARRVLWGTVGGATKLFDNFYKLVDLVLQRLYRDTAHYSPSDVAAPFIREVSELLLRTPVEYMVDEISSLQDGIALWIQDEQALLNSRHDGAVSEVVKQLAERTCSSLRSVDTPQQIRLQSIERLLSAGFQSKHRHVVNTITTTWNQIFDNVDHVQYPPALREILLSVRPLVDIVLPGVEPASLDSADVPMRDFVDSQDSDDNGSVYALSVPTSTNRSVSPGVVELAAPASKVTSNTLAPKKQTPKKQTPKKQTVKTKTKLRHEDSQMLFEPIQSSPPRDEAESQVLTERQREVRERQKDNAVLFTELRPSPQPGRNHSHSRSPAPVATPQAEANDDGTPRQENNYEEYVDSTPTPRRGQAVNLGSETEPPSSPPDPEPRRLLMPQLSAKGKRRSAVDVWAQFSSPVSRTPTRSLINQNMMPSSLAREAGEGEDAGDDSEAHEVHQVQVNQVTVEQQKPFVIKVEPNEEQSSANNNTPSQITPTRPPRITRSRSTPLSTRSMRSNNPSSARVPSSARAPRGDSTEARQAQSTTPVTRHLRTRKSARTPNEPTRASQSGSPLKQVVTPSRSSRLRRASSQQGSAVKIKTEAIDDGSEQNANPASFELDEGLAQSMVRLVEEHESRERSQRPVVVIQIDSSQSQSQPQAQIRGSQSRQGTQIRESPSPSRGRSAEVEPVEPVSEGKKRKRASTKDSLGQRKRTRASAGVSLQSDDVDREGSCEPQESQVESLPALGSQSQSVLESQPEAARASGTPDRRRRSPRKRQLPSQSPAPAMTTRMTTMTPTPEPSQFRQESSSSQLRQESSSQLRQQSSSIREEGGVVVKSSLPKEGSNTRDSEAETEDTDTELARQLCEDGAQAAARKSVEAEAEAEVVEESMVMDVDDAEERVEEVEGEAKEPAKAQQAPQAPQKVAAEEPPKDHHQANNNNSSGGKDSSSSSLVALLRQGLDALRATPALSRAEVYAVEDLFMDMKRELYEAELRGRQKQL